MKLKADGTVEKLKVRICLRGDKQEKNEDEDTWCSIGGFDAVKKFLALAAHHKCRVYQLDYIGAFLQAIARGRVITMLPTEWKESCRVFWCTIATIEVIVWTNPIKQELG